MKNLKGSTLVECIAALAIFSISTFILLGGFLTAANLTVHSADIAATGSALVNTLYTGNDNAELGITYSEENDTTFSFRMAGVTTDIKGKYISSDDNITGYALKTFLVEGKTIGDIIPGTDFYGGDGIPPNDKWPAFEDYPDQYNYIDIPEGSTFRYGDKFFIAAQDLSIGPRGATPFDSHLQWLYNNNCMIEITNVRPPIMWNGSDRLHDVIGSLGYDYLNKGDMIYWGNEYYVFCIDRQNWPASPLQQPDIWQKIVE